jgi:oligosaccharide repeat unit polymerase
MNPWSLEMYIVTLLSAFSFWCGSIVTGSNRLTVRYIREKKEVSRTYKCIMHFLFLICFSCCLIEWINGGAQLALSLSLDGGDVKSQLDGDIPGIHYGTIFLPYIAIMAYLSYINSSKKNWSDVFIIIVIILTSFLFRLSRGDMLIYILSFFFIYTRYNEVKVSRLLLIFLLLIITIIGFILLRVNKESVVMTTTDNPYFSIIYSYIATCYANLNDLIQADLPYHWTGDATLSPVWTLTGLYSQRDVTLIDQMGVFNAVTYLYSFYHDYKLLSIVVFPFFIGLTLSYIYKIAQRKSFYWILLLASMQRAIFTPFFGNYFFGDFVALYPFLFITLIILFLFSFKIKSINFNRILYR